MRQTVMQLTNLIMKTIEVDEKVINIKLTQDEANTLRTFIGNTFGLSSSPYAETLGTLFNRLVPHTEYLYEYCDWSLGFNQNRRSV
jgi:hypothetical protein